MRFFKPRDRVIVPVVLALLFSFALVPHVYDNVVFGIWPGLMDGRTKTDWMSRGPQAGEVAPEIVGTSVGGEVLRLSDYRGKVVLLKFWTNSG